MNICLLDLQELQNYIFIMFHKICDNWTESIKGLKSVPCSVPVEHGSADNIFSKCENKTRIQIFNNINGKRDVEKKVTPFSSGFKKAVTRCIKCGTQFTCL